MSNYQRKPEQVEAYQWFKDNNTHNDVTLLNVEKTIGSLTFSGIVNLNKDDCSQSYVCDSDWILTFSNGLKGVVKDSVFKEIYEEVI